MAAITAAGTTPAVAIPTYTGDMTLFNPLGERTLAALDATATITNIRTTCTDAGDRIQVVASFDNAPDRRVRDLVTGLIRHLHRFVTDHDVTDAEWAYAIDGRDLRAVLTRKAIGNGS